MHSQQSTRKSRTSTTAGEYNHRRHFGMTVLAAASFATINNCTKKDPRDRRPRESRVAVLTATAYDARLETLLLDGLKCFDLNVKGKRVLLKPNLVESSATRPINTHPALIAAA